MKRQLVQLFALTRPYRGRLAIGLLASIIGGLVGLIAPLLVGNLVDGAFLNGGSVAQIDQLALLLLLVFALESVLASVDTYLLIAVGEGMVADLRRRLYHHLLLLPVPFFDQHQTGEMTSRLNSDTTVLQTFVSSDLGRLLQQSVILVGSILFLFSISITLTLVILVVVPIVMLMASWFGAQLRRVSRAFQDQVAEANASAEESLATIRVVRWFRAERTQIGRYAALIQKTLETARRRARVYAIFVPLMTFVFLMGIVVVLWIGGRLVLTGNITGGDLVAFLLYNFTIAQSIIEFASMFGNFQKMLGASERIFELLDEQGEIAEPDTPVILTDVRGHIRLEDVYFSYANREGDVLRGVDFEVQPGEVVALVGASGAGKSTLINLLPRFYDVTTGRLMIDGVDVRDLRLDDLRAQMAAVPQEAQLLYGSAADNISLGKPDATREEVIAAAKAANAHEFVSELPEGYDTHIGERGLQLSGGQRQRIAIARALLCDPRILILDEATSALDNESEAVVQDALERLMQGRTTIVIAHRLSTVRNADRIIVMDQGRVCEVGTHDDLLAQGGLYADLYQRQFRHDNRSEPLLAASRI